MADLQKRRALRGQAAPLETPPAKAPDKSTLNRLPGEGLHEYVRRLAPDLILISRTELRRMELLAGFERSPEGWEDRRLPARAEAFAGRYVGGPWNGGISRVSEPLQRVRYEPPSFRAPAVVPTTGASPDRSTVRECCYTAVDIRVIGGGIRCWLASGVAIDDVDWYINGHGPTIPGVDIRPFLPMRRGG